MALIIPGLIPGLSLLIVVVYIVYSRFFTLHDWPLKTKSFWNCALNVASVDRQALYFVISIKSGKGLKHCYWLTGLVQTDDRSALLQITRHLQLENTVGDKVFVSIFMCANNMTIFHNFTIYRTVLYLINNIGSGVIWKVCLFCNPFFVLDVK